MNNILIVTPYFRPAQLGGGGQISVENLVDKLKDDYCVTVICYNHDFGTKTQINNSHVSKEDKVVIYFYSLKNLYKIYNELRKITFTHIYFNSFFSPICFLFQVLFLKNNKIISPKGEFYAAALKKKSYLKKSFLFFYRSFNFNVIFHSTSIHEVKSINIYFPNYKTLIARDIPSIYLVSNRIEGFESKTFKVVYSSRIESKKNLAYLPRLLMNLDGIVQFDIYGDISDKNYFEQVLLDLKTLPRNIIWKYCGRLNFNEARSIFVNYDLFLFPTLGENYGYVISESLQCGCPVLLSKNTTPWDDLDVSGVGNNIDLLDVESWIDKIKFYQSMSNIERKKVTNLCINYIQSKLDINNIVNENKEIFKSN